jgi:hypothetical protein
VPVARTVLMAVLLLTTGVAAISPTAGRSRRPVAAFGG